MFAGGKLEEQEEDRNADDIHDDEIFEFLEGLVEGFRAAYLAKRSDAGDPAFPSDEPSDGTVKKLAVRRGGDEGLGPWQELDALGQAKPRDVIATPSEGPPVEKAKSTQRQLERSATAPLRGGGGGVSGDGGGGGYPGAQAAVRTGGSSTGGGAGTMDNSGGAFDSVSNLMRLHALRSFFEETCGTVANAFDLMASTALRSKGHAGGGTSEDRLVYLFNEEEFRNILTGMGYGIDATSNWWKALFRNIDSDKDGFVSLQDMYDTMVLDLPIIDGADTYNVFFANKEERR